MEEDRLGVVDQLRLGLSRTFYSVASALPKLTDWLQSTQLSADGALWLLGQSYGDTASSTLSEQVPRAARASGKALSKVAPGAVAWLLLAHPKQPALWHACAGAGAGLA